MAKQSFGKQLFTTDLLPLDALIGPWDNLAELTAFLQSRSSTLTLANLKSYHQFFVKNGDTYDLYRGNETINPDLIKNIKYTILDEEIKNVQLSTETGIAIYPNSYAKNIFTSDGTSNVEDKLANISAKVGDFVSVGSIGERLVESVSDLKTSNSKLVVRSNIDLGGATVSMGNNSYIYTDGGLLSNGSITLSKSLRIEGDKKIFGENINFVAGYYYGILRPEWFGAVGDGSADDTGAWERCLECANKVTTIFASQEQAYRQECVTIVGRKGAEYKFTRPLYVGNSSNVSNQISIVGGFTFLDALSSEAYPTDARIQFHGSTMYCIYEFSVKRGSSKSLSFLDGVKPTAIAFGVDNGTKTRKMAHCKFVNMHIFGYWKGIVANGYFDHDDGKRGCVFFENEFDSIYFTHCVDGFVLDCSKSTWHNGNSLRNISHVNTCISTIKVPSDLDECNVLKVQTDGGYLPNSINIDIVYIEGRPFSNNAHHNVVRIVSSGSRNVTANRWNISNIRKEKTAGRILVSDCRLSNIVFKPSFYLAETDGDVTLVDGQFKVKDICFNYGDAIAKYIGVHSNEGYEQQLSHKAVVDFSDVYNREMVNGKMCNISDYVFPTRIRKDLSKMAYGEEAPEVITSTTVCPTMLYKVKRGTLFCLYKNINSNCIVNVWDMNGNKLPISTLSKDNSDNVSQDALVRYNYTSISVQLKTDDGNEWNFAQQNSDESVIMSFFIEDKDEVEDGLIIGVTGSTSLKCEIASSRMLEPIMNQNVNKKYGTTEERPSMEYLRKGFEYYDSTLGCKIMVNSSCDSWVNLDGTQLQN